MKEVVVSNEAIEQSLTSITELHDKVSMEDTPRVFVKRRDNQDYVKISYMKKLADKHFAGWSWTIISTEVLGSEAFVVHGRLKWYEGGIWREGDMTAAHRIQKLKKDPSKFSDIGNDIKAANTDCMKKAFNMYMNIADDVYKNRVNQLTQEDIDYIYKEMEGLKEEWKTQISNSIKNGDIDRTDILRVINKINRLKEESNNG